MHSGEKNRKRGYCCCCNQFNVTGSKTVRLPPKFAAALPQLTLAQANKDENQLKSRTHRIMTCCLEQIIVESLHDYETTPVTALLMTKY
jgi:hypothetical protein